MKPYDAQMKGREVPVKEACGVHVCVAFYL